MITGEAMLLLLFYLAYLHLYPLDDFSLPWHTKEILEPESEFTERAACITLSKVLSSFPFSVSCSTFLFCTRSVCASLSLKAVTCMRVRGLPYRQ